MNVFIYIYTNKSNQIYIYIHFNIHFYIYICSYIYIYVGLVCKPSTPTDSGASFVECGPLRLGPQLPRI